MEKLNETLELIGMSKEQLQERLVERVARSVLETVYIEDVDDEYDDEDELTSRRHRTKSTFARELEEHVRKSIDAAVNKIAEERVLPNVTELIESTVLQRTNEWGEKVAEPITFVEYLAQRADAWLREKVNYEGKTKQQVSSYSFSASGTRIEFLIDKHLQHSIKSAMVQALRGLNESVTEGLAEAVKIKLAEISEKLKVEVKTGR